MHYYQAGQRIGELRALAEQDRLARELREPRQLRRRIGRLLILAGCILLAKPVSSRVAHAAPEHALAIAK
jgi:hypothetical protein